MKSIKLKTLMSISAIALAVGVSGCSLYGGGPATADEQDATKLWNALVQAKQVGPNAKRFKIYPGTPPHGKILETSHEDISIDGHSSIAIIKRNFGGSGATIDSVKAHPEAYSKGLTIMYKREAGYDKENKDWFWAKYSMKGEVMSAGKIGFCSGCHMAAQGGDYVFDSNISVPSS